MTERTILYVNKAGPGVYYLYDEPSRGTPRFSCGFVKHSRLHRCFIGAARLNGGVVSAESGGAHACLSRLMAEIIDKHRATFKFENF